MISFDLRSFQRTYQEMNITCKLGNLDVIGTTKDLTSKGFCLQVPTTRIKLCLLEMLNKDVLLEIENVTIDGSIRWYTIEGERYCIGISINKPHIPAWKRLLGQGPAVVVNAGMNHAQI